MNLDDDIAVVRAFKAGEPRRIRTGSLHELHPGRSRSLIRHHNRFHLNTPLYQSPAYATSSVHNSITDATRWSSASPGSNQSRRPLPDVAADHVENEIDAAGVSWYVRLSRDHRRDRGRGPDPERAREWLAEQRVFISSGMGDTAAEGQAVAPAVEAKGRSRSGSKNWVATPTRRGGTSLASNRSTMYVGILNEQYGRVLATGFSAAQA
jgi:hypothetical protein